jgi:hypothetical protein
MGLMGRKTDANAHYCQNFSTLLYLIGAIDPIIPS